MLNIFKANSLHLKPVLFWQHVVETFLLIYQYINQLFFFKENGVYLRPVLFWQHVVETFLLNNQYINQLF